MKSNRVRVLPAVAAAVVAGAALTACSSSVQLGMAATVGSERISSSRLDSEVREYEAALKTAKVSAEQLEIPSVPRAVLLQMISIRQFDQFAQKNGIAVTQGDIDRFISDQGGLEKIGPAGLSKGVPPSETRQWVRTAMLYQRALERFGANLADQASTQAAQVKLFEQMNAIPVKVSHRYGTWDPQQGLIEEARFGKPSAADASSMDQQGAGEPDPAAGQ